MKNEFIFLVGIIIIFTSLNCNLNDRKDIGRPPEFSNKLLSESIFGVNVKLIPVSNYDFILRYEQNGGGYGAYKIVLTITKSDNKYILQLIKSDRFVNIIEKQLNEHEIEELLFSLQSFELFPRDFDLYDDWTEVCFDPIVMSS